MKYKKVKQVKEPNSDNFHKFSCKIDIDEIIKSQIGILNIGGSCYMASIIQILIHLKQFLDYFEKYRTLSPLSNKFSEFLQKVEKASNYSVEIRDLANTYYSINSKFKGTKGNNPMTFFIEFIKDLNPSISTLFTGTKNIKINKGHNVMQNYDEKFIFHMVTIDKINPDIDLVNENKKELENDKNCTITEKFKVIPEILVINLEIDNVDINFEYYQTIPVADLKNFYNYNLRGINKYTNFHSVSIIKIEDSWYKFDDYKCTKCNNMNDIFQKSKYFNYVYNLFYEKGEPIEE